MISFIIRIFTFSHYSLSSNLPFITALGYTFYQNEYQHAWLKTFACWLPGPLNLDAMQQAADYCRGEHDFSSFRSSDCQAKSPVREISVFAINQRGPMITVDVSANAFLYHMVRNLVGSLVIVGQGLQPAEWMRHVLGAKDRSLIPRMAPAHGLALIGVDYDPLFGLPQAQQFNWTSESVFQDASALVD